MLSQWTVPEAPADLKARVFLRPQHTPLRLPTFALAAGAVPMSQRMKSGAVSMLIHAAAVALLFIAFQSKTVQNKVKDLGHLVYIPNWQPKLRAMQKAGGGGGGGQKMPEPVAKGAAPKFAPKQFMPPMQAIPQPKLPVAPTITAQAPQITAELYGDPLSKVLGNSGGPGTNGLGAGSGNGIGDGNGNGYGPGHGGGVGGGVYQIGGEVSTPVPIYKIEPEYSEEARKAKYSGTVLLSIIIDADGNTRDIHVVRPLGLGLDQKAIEAVSKWRFRPAMRNGRPVAVQAQIEVSFRLL